MPHSTEPRRAATQILPILTILLLFSASLARALTPVPDTASPFPGDGFSSPRLMAAPSLATNPADGYAKSWQSRFAAFFALNSQQWEVRMDTRSDRPNLIQGAGIPVIPGRGNQLTNKDLDLRPEVRPDLKTVEASLRRFLSSYPEVLRVEDLDLRLNPLSTQSFGKDSYLWSVELQQYHEGVPVEDAYVFFRVNHGNIVQFGSQRVAEVQVDTAPTYRQDEAWAAAAARLSVVAGANEIVDKGRLKILPVLPEGEIPGQAYNGAQGRGYQHLLVWEYLFRSSGSSDLLRLRIDAHTGEVLELQDLAATATVSAKVFPNTNTDPLLTVNLPFTSVTNGGSVVTDGAGNYPYIGGTATAQLNGRFVSVSDTCGAISLSDSFTGNLAFGGIAGTNCTSPGVGGSGNTNAARTSFYNLTNINRKAAGFFPGNTWLDGTLLANTNINDVCNAFWDGINVNFFHAGVHPITNLSCSNTGEIAAIAFHEWGHGMDQNSGGAASEKGSGEAVGDTFAFLETKDACIGPNFSPGVACANCRPTCTGVRDLAAFALGGIRTIARPSNVTSNTGLNCDNWACPFGYQGPMGYEGHCESYIASTANWDLAQALIGRHGASAGWAKLDQIWYSALTPSKSAYQVASGGLCNPNAVVDGCAATNWYTTYLPADDDDGNLANGTPNGCRIWDSFNAHGIACGSRPACTGEYAASSCQWSGAIKESNGTAYSCPAGKVMTGRQHSGDENGNTWYHCCDMGNPNLASTANPVWTGNIKESNGTFYTCPFNKVLTGRQHSGDENGNTRYLCSDVLQGGSPVSVNTGTCAWSGNVKESSGIQYLCPIDQVMVGRQHSGDENGNSRYYCCKLQ